MQTLEARRAYLREYREKNIEKFRMRNWEYKNRKLGRKERIYIPKSNEKQSANIYSAGFPGKSYKEIEVKLCQSCGRKYLTKLYCLWCTGK